MPNPKIDFSFLFHDVKRQRELAQQALAEAKAIDALLTADPNRSDKSQLEEAKKKWLDMARALAENANTTSSSASTAVSMILSSS